MNTRRDGLLFWGILGALVMRAAFIVIGLRALFFLLADVRGTRRPSLDPGSARCAMSAGRCQGLMPVTRVGGVMGDSLLMTSFQERPAA